MHTGLAFWAGARGLPAGAATIEEPYTTLGYIGGLHLVAPRVSEPKTSKSRVHLDIETDDIEAEVRRLEALGARRAEGREGWWVMRDPCGNEFCVFGPQLSTDGSACPCRAIGRCLATLAQAFTRPRTRHRRPN